MTSREVIRGEVADILDQITLVLNVGKDMGVKKGMRFIVYVEAERLLDSKFRDLGVLEIPKAEVEVVDVQPKLSIAKSASTYTESGYTGFVESIRPLTREVRRPLPIEKGDIKPRDIEMSIKKGDKVRQVE